jgi:hypothetical protein
MKLENKYFKNAYKNMQDYKSYLQYSQNDVDFTSEIITINELLFKIGNAIICNLKAIWLNDKEATILEEATDYQIEILENTKHVILITKQYIKEMEV